MLKNSLLMSAFIIMYLINSASFAANNPNSSGIELHPPVTTNVKHKSHATKKHHRTHHIHHHYQHQTNLSHK